MFDLNIKSFHFKDRLFDRDTLFVHQYQINFLYTLKSYSTFNETKTLEFRSKTSQNLGINLLNFLIIPKKQNLKYSKKNFQ